MSNNNKDWRQDDEGNDKDSNTTAQGGVWRRRNWYNRTFSYSLGQLGKIRKTSVKMLLISLIFWVVFFIGALIVLEEYAPEGSLPGPRSIIL